MKRFFSLVVLFVGVFALASCGGNQRVHTTDHSVLELADYTQLSATVSFWHAMGADKEAVIQKLADKFNETYPNIKIELTSQGGYDDLRDNILAKLSVGAGPTIAQTYPDHVSLYVDANSMKKLDGFLNHSTLGLSTERIADYVPSYYQEGRLYDSAKTLYSLPFNKSTEALYINATWFENNGLLEQYNLGEIKDVTYGTGEAAYTVKEFVANEGAHLTWQDIEAIAQFYTSTPEYANATANERATRAALGVDSEANFFITKTYQFGGQYTGFDSSGKGVILFGNDVKAKDAMRWLLSSYTKGYVGTAGKFGTDYCSDAFKAQQIKMTTGSSAGSTYNMPAGSNGSYAFTYGVLPYPQEASSYNVDGTPNYEKQYVIQQGTNVSLFKRSTAEEEAAGWLFMRYISNDPAAQFLWSKETGYLPSISSVWDMPEYDDFLNGVDRSGATPVYSEPSIVVRTIKVAIAQQPAYFTNVAFKGSSKARDELKNTIVDGILYAGVDLDQAFANAVQLITASMK